MNKTIIAVLVALQSITLLGQETIFHLQADQNYERAMEMYNKEKYSTAQKFFEKAYEQYKDQNTELKALSQYYMAQCAVRLFNEDAEYLTQKFIDDNPSNPLVFEARFNLAGYFYMRKKYRQGIEHYSRIDVDKLTDEQRAEYYFKKGYCHFMLNETEQAKLDLFKIINEKSSFQGPALYYYSHIHYDEGNYQTALNGFKQLTHDKYFGAVVPYYIVHIYYEQKNYDAIIEFVPGIIDNVTDKRIAEVSRIAAEAFYQRERYGEAIPYFKLYADTATSVKKTDKYQLAYCYYKADSIDQAINIFETIASADDKVSQNAAYYLAACYLKQNDKANARKAFGSASRMEYDPLIKQDALFNFALLSFEQPNDPLNESITAFEEYIRLYPAAKNVDEAQKFLVQAYLKTKNYSKALESIERVGVQNEDLKRAYQRIAYSRGVELFNNLDFTGANDLFSKALKYGKYDKVLYAKSLYWNAETNYRVGNYGKSVELYKEFKNAQASYMVPQADLADYGLGYAYFQQKQYPMAVQAFVNFTGKASEHYNTQKEDAYVRAGDAYFVQSNYLQAITYYDKALQMQGSSLGYAMFQKGLCYGLTGDHNQKIQVLERLISGYPNSSYADDAAYEKAQAYLNLQQQTQAIAALSELIAKYPESTLRPNAQVQLGLLYYNTDNNSKAIEVLKKAVVENPGSQASRDALTGLKNVYIDINQVEEYTSFVNSLGSGAPQITVSEQDSLLYTSAENIYMSGDCEKSVPAFERYIDKFPNGVFLLNAHFYKADCQTQKQEYEKAMPSLRFILAQPKNIYTSQALIAAARISMQQKNYSDAIQWYQQLLNSSTSAGNKKEAQLALMNAYYAADKFVEAQEMAKQVAAIDGVAPQDARRAKYIIAKVYEENGQQALALEADKDLAKEVMSAEGAEAKYKVAEIQFNRGEAAEAEKTILSFSEAGSPHDYWIARSFILWSDVFASRKDYFQAIQTLQSIIDYYEVSTDGVLDTAKAKKDEFLAIQQADEKPAATEDVEVEIEN